MAILHRRNPFFIKNVLWFRFSKWQQGQRLALPECSKCFLFSTDFNLWLEYLCANWSKLDQILLMGLEYFLVSFLIEVDFSIKHFSMVTQVKVFSPLCQPNRRRWNWKSLLCLSTFQWCHISLRDSNNASSTNVLSEQV